jgi:hypothetical protein
MQGLEDVCEEAKQSAKLTLCRERLSEKCALHLVYLMKPKTLSAVLEAANLQSV